MLGFGLRVEDWKRKGRRKIPVEITVPELQLLYHLYTLMSEPVFPEAGPSRSRPLSHDRPSLFELLAEEQLKDLYHPVIRYVLSASPLSPPPLPRLSAWVDRIVLCSEVSEVSDKIGTSARGGLCFGPTSAGAASSQET
jgi:hypothetical protein